MGKKDKEKGRKESRRTERSQAKKPSTGSYSEPSSRNSATACIFECTPSFEYTLPRCFFTVSRDTTSTSAASATEAPSATMRRHSSSRSVSKSAQVRRGRFWLALLLLIVFAVWLKVLPIGLSVPIGAEAATLAQRLRHALLPALTLSVTGASSIALHTREKTADVMDSDYILFARARGEGHIVLRHVPRNVALPAITLQFASIGELIGGSVLVEQVFSYPGLGQAAVAAGLGGDMPLLLGITVITAAIVFGGNLAADLLYGVIDPRIRRGAARK